MIKSDERSEDSYLGLADFFLVCFFSGKSLKICSRSILIFRALTCDFFFFSSLQKGRKKPLSNSNNIKVTKNVIDF